ncbi:MAG: iron-containing alcohol dehydrogenase, partial [Candidatus Omnitrophica bacterium]|nr:iron-containing alcohol dehydrogenase [Candidatus Omnitrophota bacterium]
QTKEKRATSSPVLIPAFSILNPEFTFSVDAYNTAAGIADIMAHVFENYLTPIPHADVQDRMAEALLKICIHYGPIVCSQPKNYDARANIMWASSLALNGVAGKGKISDWVCHAIEHELSGLYDISHGVGLAILLPHFMKEFLTSETIVNFVNYGTRVWDIDANNDSQSIAEEAIKKTRDFFSSIGLPATLHELGISNEHFEAIMSAAIQCRGKVGHYKQLTRKNIMNILNAAL